MITLTFYLSLVLESVNTLQSQQCFYFHILTKNNPINKAQQRPIPLNNDMRRRREIRVGSPLQPV